MKNIENIKTTAFFIVVALAIILLSLSFYNKTYLPSKVPEKETCTLLIIDNTLTGFGAETERCEELKKNCESDKHNISCEWVILTSTNGTNIQACKCET